jgi:hypothetical protein
MQIDRRSFIASLGGAAAVKMMSHEARAEALEYYMSQQLEAAAADKKPKFPTAAEMEAQITTRSYRRGVGSAFLTTAAGSKVTKLPPLPERPTFLDFFKLRFGNFSNHVLQSATRAMKTGMSEEVILACLLHDTIQVLMKTDHGWWGADLYAPYVSEKVAFAIRYHQALRFFPDPANGYEYPDLYRSMFGEDYVPSPHIQEAYKFVRNHKWYLEPRMVTVNDLYAFDPNAVVTIDPFLDIVGRRFRNPKEGLGNDNSPSAHMWRTIATPDNPL